MNFLVHRDNLTPHSSSASQLLKSSFEVKVRSTRYYSIFTLTSSGRSHSPINKRIPTRHYIACRHLNSSACKNTSTWGRNIRSLKLDCVRDPNLLKGVYAMGFKKPSKIQERALPLLLQNPFVIRRIWVNTPSLKELTTGQEI